jgi:type IV pilus assembly protein PilQ
MKVRALSVSVALLLSAGLMGWAQEKPADPKQDPQQASSDAQRRALEAAAGRLDVKVTIDAKNATVAWVVDQFRAQVPHINFVLEEKGWDEAYRVKPFKVVNEPWRSALTAFLAIAEGTMDEDSPTLIRISRPPRVTFAFKDAPIKTVVDLIARMSGANIILHPDVQGSVTMSVNNVPWNAVLDAVVKTVGNYTTVREKYDIIRIVPASELLKQMEVKVFKLTFIQPPATYRAKIEPGKYFQGVPIPSPASVAEQELQFTLLVMLRGMLTRDAGGTEVGSIKYDPNLNALSVRDTKVVLNRIEETLKLLDREPEQVTIDVKFISTVNEDLLNFGTNWSFLGEDGMGFNTVPIHPLQFNGPTGTGVNTGPLTRALNGKVTRLPFGMGQEFQNTDQFFMTQFDMTATFRAFKRDRFSKIVQGPNLSVVDNSEATIFVGEQVPYAEVRATANQFGGLEFSIAEGQKSPVRVGFQLLVIPKIIPDSNKVIMTIIPVNEFLSGTGTGTGLVPGFERFTLQGAGQGGSAATIDLPRVSTTTLVTRLMVESGRTAVLGGLVNERSTYQDSKIPILGDIPLINYFFKNRSDTIRREHLLIFITPRIVRSSSAEQENLRALLREQQDRERRELEQMRLRDAQDQLKKDTEKRNGEKASEVPK